jgi:hypothetical protein
MHRVGWLVVALWVALSVVRLSRLVEPAETPPGQAAAPTFQFFSDQIPRTDGYLFVLPGEFGADTGLGPRLRYELYPRVYDDVRASRDAAAVRELMRRERLRFVVVPDASQYASSHWTRADNSWLRRIELDANRYVLEVIS